MFKNFILAGFSSLSSVSRLFLIFTLNSAALGDIPVLKAPLPYGPTPVTPPGVTIATYTTDETVTFESQAKPAMDARINALKAAGITSLGGRVVELGNDYSFVIDYIPTVKNGAALPPAVLVETYKNGASYWLDSEAKETINDCAANFRAAKLPVLGSYLYDVGSDSAFDVDYLVKNLLRPTQEYDVKFKNYTGGKFTFESEAVKNIPAYLALFKQAGVPAIRGKAVARPDGDYAVAVEYVIKTNKYGARPQYSVSRYYSRETFTFDKEALKASKAALPAFASAGVPPLRRGGPKARLFLQRGFRGQYLPAWVVIPSAAIETYQPPRPSLRQRGQESHGRESRRLLRRRCPWWAWPSPASWAASPMS